MSFQNFGNKYAIFDMDGTLINSNQFLDTITTLFFEKRNCSYSKEFLLATKTMSRESFCTAVKELTHEQSSMEELFAEIDGYMMDVYRNDVELMPDAVTLLENFKNAGIRMCIGSATDSKSVRFVLDRFKISAYFDFISSCNDIGKDKDEPDVFLNAVSLFGAASPKEITVYEDSAVAMKTAKNAGFKVVGIYDPQETGLSTIKELCDLTICSFSELL